MTVIEIKLKDWCMILVESMIFWIEIDQRLSFLDSCLLTLLSAVISSTLSVSCIVRSFTNSCIFSWVEGPERLLRNDLSCLIWSIATVSKELRSISASSLSEYSWMMYLYSVIYCSFSSRSSFIEMFSYASISRVDAGTSEAASYSVFVSSWVKVISA